MVSWVWTMLRQPFGRKWKMQDSSQPNSFLFVLQDNQKQNIRGRKRVPWQWVVRMNVFTAVQWFIRNVKMVANMDFSMFMCGKFIWDMDREENFQKVQTRRLKLLPWMSRRIVSIMAIVLLIVELRILTLREQFRRNFMRPTNNWLADKHFLIPVSIWRTTSC